MSTSLPAEPNIRGIEGLHEQLTAIADQGEVELDGSEVSRIDTAALQLLAAFFVDRQRTGKSTRWASASDSLHDAAAVAGLHTQIGLKDAD